MKAIIYGQEYPCAKAVKGDNFVRLYDENNTCVAVFDGISNFDGYSIEGGDWEEPAPTETEQLRADVDFVMAMEGLL